MQILQPPEWAKPKGYSNGIVAKGRTVYLAGQFGCNAEGKFDSGDFAAQARQALKNIVAILAQAGAGPEHICRLNWYVADRKEYIASIGSSGRDQIARGGEYSSLYHVYFILRVLPSPIFTPPNLSLT